MARHRNPFLESLHEVRSTIDYLIEERDSIGCAETVASDTLPLVLSALRGDLFIFHGLYHTEELRELACYACALGVIAIEQIEEVIALFDDIYETRNSREIVTTDQIIKLLERRALIEESLPCTIEDWISRLGREFPPEPDDEE